MHQHMMNRHLVRNEKGPAPEKILKRVLVLALLAPDHDTAALVRHEHQLDRGAEVEKVHRDRGENKGAVNGPFLKGLADRVPAWFTGGLKLKMLRRHHAAFNTVL